MVSALFQILILQGYPSMCVDLARIDSYLTAQQYIDGIFRHFIVSPFDNHALADRFVFMQHTSKTIQDVLNYAANNVSR